MGLPESFHFELVSPEEKFMSGEAWQVSIPGEEGYMGIRAGHASLVSSLKNGVIEVLASKDTKDVRRIFVAGGFADITAENCVVLAEDAIDVKDLDQAQLEQYASDLRDDLKMTQDPQKLELINTNLDSTLEKLRAAALYS